jgi:colicin import membrane protein
MTPRKSNTGYSGKNPGISSMILLSLLAHLFVITLILFAIPTTARHLTFGPIYSVQLVSSSDIALSNNQGSSLLNEIERSNDAASSIIYKRQITGLAPTPVKKDESSKVNVEKAVSDIQQKEQNTQNANRASAAAGTSKIPPGDAGARTKDYIAAIGSRVKSNWSIPPTLLPKENIETIVEIKIMRDGSLASADFEKRSGNRYFDDTALKAVRKSAPFPPMPEWYPDNSLEIGIRFHSAELR